MSLNRKDLEQVMSPIWKKNFNNVFLTLVSHISTHTDFYERTMFKSVDLWTWGAVGTI